MATTDKCPKASILKDGLLEYSCQCDFGERIMNDITVVIPGDALVGAKIPRHRLESELRKQLALQLYREQLVSGAGACRIAGISKAEFQHFLGDKGVSQQYDVEDYQKDRENLATWRAND
jgi:predicted HTH domain antitoxin